MLEARSDGTPLEMAVASSVAWDRLAQLVATGTQLSNTLADEPLAYVGQGYHRFRRYGGLGSNGTENQRKKNIHTFHRIALKSSGTETYASKMPL